MPVDAGLAPTIPIPPRPVPPTSPAKRPGLRIMRGLARWVFTPALLAGVLLLVLLLGQPANAALRLPRPQMENGVLWQGVASLTSHEENDWAFPTLTTGSHPAFDERLVSRDLLTWFATFDANGDGLLEVAEANRFYEWVSLHVAYRYDNEGVEHPVAGVSVGDGREGMDYWQTPVETFTEAAGDCEDLSLLEVAFYRYWNVPAYLALVNARSEDRVDHAVALVFGATNETGLRAGVGRVPYYEFEGRDGVPDGLYIIVDNTYSHVYGQVSGGIEEGKFELFKLVSFSKAYEGAGRQTPVVP